MKERPILFSGPMVRAILAGTKTQTRRVVKRQGDMEFDPADPHYGPYWLAYAAGDLDGEDAKVRCPYGVPGDRLWVRETWAENAGSAGGYLYRADHGDKCSGIATLALDRAEWVHYCDRWRPSIHMPRTASRILLEITDVRVERLQAISDADALAEGTMEWVNWDSPQAKASWAGNGAYAGGAFPRFWESINGAGSWDANPRVWVVSFKRLQP
jgi:hypothetical protein